MLFLGKSRKSDLIELGTELGVTIPLEVVIANIKRLITSSETYDEEFVKQVFERIIEERIKREENERLEKEKEKQRQIEIEEREKQRQTEIEEREKQRQIEIEEREKQRQIEIEEREKQRTFELEKLKLLNENKVMYQTSTEYDTNVPENRLQNV
ncbi:hypothetical protein CEXT_204141 [Caerostris extrusa]|uniref:Uncharacterized protein n=1 Tax=Caerostris extrusa TaxID=172846 RepID=A0AAV4PP72_CAEEX|nr:hypothetical protein CEXT_204141 [Caerostris extrusa]